MVWVSMPLAAMHYQQFEQSKTKTRSAFTIGKDATGLFNTWVLELAGCFRKYLTHTVMSCQFKTDEQRWLYCIPSHANATMLTAK